MVKFVTSDDETYNQLITYMNQMLQQIRKTRNDAAIKLSPEMQGI